MKKILLFLLLFIPVCVFAAGSVTINKSELTIEKGTKDTFTITATNAAGAAYVTINDSTVASFIPLNDSDWNSIESKTWVENGSKTFEVTGLKVGTATITVILDVATFDEEEIKETKTINVTVVDGSGGGEPLNPPQSTIEFSTNSINCEKNQSINAYVISSSNVTTYSSDKENIATIVANPSGNSCPNGTANCYEVKVTCLSEGQATLTATNTDNKTSNVSVTVVDGSSGTDVEDEITITFDGKGGTGCGTKTVIKNQAVGKLCTPTRKGYEFLGWFSEGGTEIKETTVLDRDFTIYARWRAVSNPPTGIFTPILGMLVLAVASVLTFVILTKKSKMLN